LILEHFFYQCKILRMCNVQARVEQVV